MKLSRAEYVEVCKTCAKRTTSMKTGLICSLTNEQAAFEGDTCSEYVVDPKAASSHKRQDTEKKQSSIRSIIAGIAITIIGFTWLIVGLFNGILFYYSFALIVAGPAILTIGINNYNKSRLRLKEKEVI